MLVVLLLSFVAFGTSGPAIHTKIGIEGLKFLSEQRELIEQYVNNAKIPENRGKKLGIKYELTEGHITGFQSPKVNFKLTDRNSIIITSSGGSVSAAAKWRLQKRMVFNLRTSGSVTASASSINFRIETGISVLNGRPSFHIASCEGNIDNISLKFRDGLIGIFINAFKRVIQNWLKKHAPDMICKQAHSAIERLNGKLQALQLQKAFGSNKDYIVFGNVLNPITTTPAFLQTDFAVSVKVNGVGDCPANQPQVPAAQGNPMAYVMVGAGIAQCAANLLHAKKALGYWIADDKGKGQLQTTCKLLCIGSVIPPLAQNYPNKSVVLHLYTIQPPAITINKNGVSVAANIQADALVDQKVVGSFKIVGSMRAMPVMGNGVIKGRIDEVNLKMSYAGVSDTSLENIAGLLALEGQEHIQKYLDKGIPLPSAYGITVAPSSAFVLSDGYIGASVNFVRG